MQTQQITYHSVDIFNYRIFNLESIQNVSTVLFSLAFLYKYTFSIKHGSNLLKKVIKFIYILVFFYMLNKKKIKIKQYVCCKVQIHIAGRI